MGRMDAIARLGELITPRWRRLLDVRRPAYHELTLEFHSTFRFDSARLTSLGAVSFALGRRTHIMSVAQFAVHAGLYTEEETSQPVFTESLMGWTDVDVP